MLDFYSSTSLSRLRSTTQLATHGVAPISIRREVEKSVRSALQSTVGRVSRSRDLFLFGPIANYLLVRILETRWSPLVLPSAVINMHFGRIFFFYYRQLLASEKSLYNAGFPLCFNGLRRVSSLVWAEKYNNALFQVHSLVQHFFYENCPIARC